MTENAMEKNDKKFVKLTQLKLSGINQATHCLMEDNCSQCHKARMVFHCLQTHSIRCPKVQKRQYKSFRNKQAPNVAFRAWYRSLHTDYHF